MNELIYIFISEIEKAGGARMEWIADIDGSLQARIVAQENL